MSPRCSVLWLVLAVASAGLVAGCGDGPVGPSDGVVRVEIQGPGSIALEQSAQYAVIEYLVNGTTRALPSAAWASSDSSLVQVTSSGVATAGSRIGEVSLTVRTTQSASRKVVVLPAHAVGLAGSYTLTIEAGSSCRVPLAEELQRRSYLASVTQDGTRLDVVLTEPRFVNPEENNGRFFGHVTSTGVSFLIEGGWTIGSTLMEQLPDGSVLAISGIVHTTESSGVLSGSLYGWFSHYRGAGLSLGECDAARFTLSRR